MSDKITKISDLKVYAIAYELAMKIFRISSRFPKSETYSLTDQIIRSSRSVAANIREGYARRDFEKVFINFLSIATGSLEETRTWLSFAKDCEYTENEIFEEFESEYDKLSAMIYKLSKNWKTY